MPGTVPPPVATEAPFPDRPSSSVSPLQHILSCGPILNGYSLSSQLTGKKYY